MNPTDGKVVVSIEIDAERLGGYTDEFLASCWHVAQANPAPIGDKAAADLAERVGCEIIRRWLKGVGPELYHHQGKHHYWGVLCDNGKWDDHGEWHPNAVGGGQE